MTGNWTLFIALVLAGWMFSAGHTGPSHAAAADLVFQAGSVGTDRSGDRHGIGEFAELTADEDWPDLDCQGSILMPRTFSRGGGPERRIGTTGTPAARSATLPPHERPPDLLPRSSAHA
ncbi:hypothetical protein [Phreatobacter stygius]|uniref:Uncharacterized protein n=1 Tax=Phreatobacter stygius TaxID=1940610 RepID=A0A4D7AXF1_9HYPH|nr:hypothetical protein [Phreatobacter stygius]QCI63593.1 hypothetical protein E8M01_04660 [Phreatobacter stygius]